MTFRACQLRLRSLALPWFLILSGMVLFPRPVPAQSELPQEAKEELTKKLPSGAQAVVQQLFALGSLPQPQWRIHPADIPHGEALDLDDSTWETVTTPSHGPTSAVWYRAWIEVPKNVNGYDITGAKIFFNFNVSADGLGPTIVYFDGRRVAMGDDLEPIVLFGAAKPGEKVLVAVKLTRSIEPKHFAGAELRIEPRSGGSSPEMLWQEIFSMGEVASALGPNAADAKRQIEAASAAVNFEALHHGDQQAFGRSLAQSHAALATLDESIKKLMEKQ